MAWPKETRYLGKPHPRLDGPAKVSGRAHYMTDVAPAGMLYGAVFRSRWAAARITSINLEKARKAPGIRAAIVLAEGEIVARYYGQELAAVAGESRQAVFDALELIEAQATAMPVVVDEVVAMRPDAQRVYQDRPNATEPVERKEGDVDAAFAAAAASVEATFSTPVLLHQPIEPHGAVVQVSPDEVRVWGSSQFIFGIRDSLAQGLQVPQNQVRVTSEYMGGGFGSKIEPWAHNLIAARLAQAAGAPVKLVYTRAEEALCVGNRPSSFQRIRLAAGADGKLTAFELHGFGTPGHVATPQNPGGGVIDYPAPYIYAVPNTRVKRSKVAVHAGLATWMRAPGCPVASFAFEGILDELALKLGIDPLEMRLRNDPLEMRRREFEMGAERIGWKERYRAPGTSPGPVKTGLGCAGAAWPGGGHGTQAEVQINADGTVEVRCGTQDLGTGSRTVVAMVAAEMLGIDLERVTARVGDTRFPPSGVSGGSTTTASVSPAVYDACEKALAELARVSGVADPRGESWDGACAKLGIEPLVAAGRWREGLSSSGAGGAQFAEVEVDTETGFVRVKRIVCVQDCGLVVNRLTCESQVNGGIIMGLGFALYEQRIMDTRSGVVLNPNFETYKVPGAADMPSIEVTLLDMPGRGVIGVGEPVTVPTAAAIANAVSNAIGVRVSSLPITPDKVLAALGTVPPARGRRDPREALDAAFQQVAAADAVTPAQPVTRYGRIYA